MLVSDDHDGAEEVEMLDEPAAEAQRLCRVFADAIAHRGAKRPSVTDAWVTEMERLVRIDGRRPDDVERVIRWLSEGTDDVATFWAPNVRSPHKLRQKWDQMAEQYRNRVGRRTTDRSTDAAAYALRRAAEIRTQGGNA